MTLTDPHRWWPTRRELLFATLTAVALYLAIATNLELLSWVDHLFLSSADANSYLAVNRWLTGGEATGHLTQRPIFYPSLMLIYRAAGPWGMWILQAGCWVVSALLVSAVVMRLTGSRAWRGITLIVFATQVSLVVLTFHGLAESVSVAGACLWLWVATAQPVAQWTARRVALLVLVLAMLTITKPVYQLMVLGFAPLVIYWWLRFGGRKPASAVLVAAGLTPIAQQVMLVWATHDLITISTIGVDALRLYFVPLVYQDLHAQPSIELARAAVSDLGTTGLLGLLAEHPGVTVRVYLRTLVFGNIMTTTAPGLLPPGEGGGILIRWSGVCNLLLGWVHASMIIPVCWAVWARRDWLLGTLWLFGAGIILSAGASIWQGDRLVVIAAPWWLAVYALTASHWIRRGRAYYSRRRWGN